jgi:hypothetical protein
MLHDTAPELSPVPIWTAGTQCPGR